jgi:hypothetical protein
MSGAYEEIPMESGPFSMLASIFAVPLRPVPRYLRSLRAFAGANPLKWVLVALAVVGYVVAIVTYFVFALFPAVSYALLILLTLPLTIAVYVWKGLLLVAGSARRARSTEAEPRRVRSAVPSS